MKRMELIACEAVQAELMEGLTAAIKDLEFTLLPRVEGRGMRTSKEGTQVWPEMNFMLISYLDDDGIETAKAVIADVARRFPKEGIFAAFSEAERIK
jgi:hypothetical protein